MANRSPLWTNPSWGLATFYSALFLLYGVQVPFLPVWLEYRGLSAVEIAFVSAAPFFLRIAVSPLLSQYADRKASHRTVLFLLSLVAVLVAALLIKLTVPIAIIVFVVILTIVKMSMMPLIETIAVGAVQKDGIDYGRVRLWGSLSFIVMSVIAGSLIDKLGAGVIIWLVLGAALTIVAAIFVTPASSPLTYTNEAVDTPPANNHDDVQRKNKLENANNLLKNSNFILFLIAGGFVQAAHATFYIFGAIIWQNQGLSAQWIAALWAIGVIAEITLFAFSKVLIQSIGAAGLLFAGALAAVFRWTCMSFEPGLVVLVPLQVLHGLTFGAAHVGAIHFMSATVPKNRMGLAQAIYGSVAAGCAMGLAMLAAGPLYNAYGTSSYLAMSGLGMIALIASIALLRRSPEDNTFEADQEAVGNAPRDEQSTR